MNQKLIINNKELKTFMVIQQKIKNFGESEENYDLGIVKAFCIEDAILKALEKVGEQMIENCINIDMEFNEATIALEENDETIRNYLDIKEVDQ